MTPSTTDTNPTDSEADHAYAALVRDLAALAMGISPGSGATVRAVVRPEPDALWVGLAPWNQLIEQYALRIPLSLSDGRPRGFEDVLLVLRRSESLRRHSRRRFDRLDTVGELHGMAVRDSREFLDDPPLDMFQDALRGTLLTAAFRGPAPLPPDGTTRLAGFAWLLDNETQWARLYLDSPTEAGTLGVDVDVAHGSDSVPDLMHCLDRGVPDAWSPHELTPDPFCLRMFDLRDHPGCE
ncbi:hypothetical protein SAMN04487819_108172 [Actinopolyspora alba]|uniref:Uncharacterized protein n=1 Tax=Actinopolyspora alba TaxID=673379 RepID=A0A1I1Y9Q5_9ACTN|nr:hypothetical protein [Actinopolyspora alba]SFE14610.1 hypothetical protein SAMN04487819_108172 [Actinopolyspora alba]